MVTWAKPLKAVQAKARPAQPGFAAKAAAVSPPKAVAARVSPLSAYL